jgi:hypothetical protein
VATVDVAIALVVGATALIQVTTWEQAWNTLPINLFSRNRPIIAQHCTQACPSNTKTSQEQPDTEVGPPTTPTQRRTPLQMPNNRIHPQPDSRWVDQGLRRRRYSARRSTAGTVIARICTSSQSDQFSM